MTAEGKGGSGRSDEHNARGIDLADRGWIDEAIREFRRAIELNPRSPHAHDNLATALSQKRCYVEALEEYLESLRLDPRSATAHYNLACFLSQHAHDLAVSEYERAIAIDSASADAHLNLGLTYAELGRVEPAKTELAAASALLPEDPIPRQELAALLMEQGDHRGAIVVLRELVRLEPASAEAWLHLGACYMRKGFYEEAERAYQRARAERPEDALVGYSLASLYALWGRREEVLLELQRVLALDRTRVLCWLRSDGAFEPLQDDPGFRALLES